MSDFLGIDAAQIIGNVFGDKVHEVIIERQIAGERAAGDLAGGVKKEPTRFYCRGFLEDFTGTPPAGVQLEANDRRLTIIGASLAVGAEPRRNDRVIVVEPTGNVSMYVAQALSRDPGRAALSFLCRDRRGPDMP